MASEPISILYLEDSDLDAEVVRRRLERMDAPVRVERVSDRRSFVERLESRRWDVILSDYQVPGFDGLASLEAARARQAETPFIYVSGAMGEELAVEAIKRGATDYVIKDRLTRLCAAVRRAVDEAAARRLAREALAASEERFKTLRDTAPAMLWAADAGGKCTFRSRGWQEFTGQREAEALGDGWLRAVHPEDRDRAGWAHRAPGTAGDVVRVEYRLRRADGEYRWAIDLARARLGDRGELLGYVGNVLDNHAHRLAEDELAVHREGLEKLVRERTAELEASHERLRLSERMAAIGTLSAGLGHDMGNVLLPVRVRLDELARADLPDYVKRDIEAIRTATDYLRRLSSGLRLLALDPSGGERGEATELSRWWEEAGPMMRNVMPRGVTLEGGEGPGGWDGLRVKAGKPALTQAVFNLVQNAGDALRTRGAAGKGGTVRVWAKGRGDVVEIGVSDDGPGMTAEVRARCMEPFFTTKARDVSTGLGLALVYGLVKEMGGEIALETELGRGTTFRMMLPAGSVADGAAAKRRAVVAVREARLRALVTAELKSLAYAVSHDADGAADGAAEGPADLAVVDEAGRGRANAGAVVLIGDGTAVGGVIALGPKPTLQAVREAIRSAAGRARDPGAGSV